MTDDSSDEECWFEMPLQDLRPNRRGIQHFHGFRGKGVTVTVSEDKLTVIKMTKPLEMVFGPPTDEEMENEE